MPYVAVAKFENLRCTLRYVTVRVSVEFWHHVVCGCWSTTCSVVSIVVCYCDVSTIYFI